MAFVSIPTEALIEAVQSQNYAVIKCGDTDAMLDELDFDCERVADWLLNHADDDVMIELVKSFVALLRPS